MKSVTSAEFQHHFERYLDEALINPISITRNGREPVVMISAEEYRRIKRSMHQSMQVEALSEQDLTAIEQADIPKGHEDLDDEFTK